MVISYRLKTRHHHYSDGGSIIICKKLPNSIVINAKIKYIIIIAGIDASANFTMNHTRFQKGISRPVTVTFLLSSTTLSFFK